MPNPHCLDLNGFARDRFAVDLTGIEIDWIHESSAQCSLLLTPMHLNGQNQVMGGVVFTLCDFAFAVASNTRHSPTVSLNAQINYHSGTRGTRLFAKAQCVRDGRNTCYYTVEVYDDLERHIASASITGFKKYPEEAQNEGQN